MTTQPRIFRLGTAKDVGKLQAIEIRAGEIFRGIGMPDIADAPPTEDTVFQKAINEELLFVVTVNNVPAGFALMINHGDNSHLHQISIDHCFLGQGIGSALLLHIINVCHTIGYKYITLSTFIDVPWNLPFYQKHGFSRLPNDNLPPQLVAIRQHESDSGLIMSERTLMVFYLT